MVVYSKIPAWLRYSVYWITPLQYGTKSLTLNEFSASKYDVPAPNNPSQRIGDYYLETFDLPTDFVWKWMGVVYLAGWWLVWTAMCVFVLRRMTLVSPQGSRREHYFQQIKEKLQQVYKNKEADNKNQTVTVEMAQLHSAPSAAPATSDITSTIPTVSPTSPSPSSPVAARPGGFQLSALPFTPATLAWSDLNYSITLPNGTERVLLNSVSGYAKPGEMTALMGASGAGQKSTHTQRTENTSIIYDLFAHTCLRCLCGVAFLFLLQAKLL